jgi:16S rRNA (guanine1516-N2)-methyltransferase
LAILLPSLTELILSLAATDETALPRARLLAGQLGLTLSELDENMAQLRVGETSLALHVPALGKPFFIDFSAGKYDHRRQFGGGRGQPLARAVGLKKGQTPSVIDATAGFARDSFVLASLGCDVTMLEQNPVMAALIEDALARGREEAAIADITSRMQIYCADAVQYLGEHKLTADVIYLDPMYPSREKSALVKKEMQLLHQLVGSDSNSDTLLSEARQKALKRVVVKRPKGADYLGGQKPAASVQSKNTRFDIYPSLNGQD